jgi:hypothetical protein
MKSQASFEFMFLTAFLIIAATFFILLFQNQFAVAQTTLQSQLKDICANIAEKINEAFTYGDGFEENITLPSSLENNTYSVIVTNQSVVCRVSDTDVIERFLTNNVKNATSNQPFIIPTRQIKIVNVGGVVNIL